LLFQEEENGILWAGLSEQLLDAMLIDSHIRARLKMIDFINGLLELGLPIGGAVVIVEYLDLDFSSFLNFNQIQHIRLIEESYIGTLFSSTACSA
jgi:hypothetical protein